MLKYFMMLCHKKNTKTKKKKILVNSSRPRFTQSLEVFFFHIMLKYFMILYQKISFHSFFYIKVYVHSLVVLNLFYEKLIFYIMTGQLNQHILNRHHFYNELYKFCRFYIYCPIFYINMYINMFLSSFFNNIIV
jgi:hypothetical protein